MTDLVQRLREPVSFHYNAETINAERREAATALEAKDKEIEELRERVKQDELAFYGLMKAKEAAEARAETAERELNHERETFQRHEKTLRDNGIASHSEAVVLVVTLRQVFDDILDELGCERNNEAALEAIATLRRERDEARAALKPLSDLHWLISDLDESPDSTVFFQHDGTVITFGEIRAARAVIEKE